MRPRFRSGRRAALAWIAAGLAGLAAVGFAVVRAGDAGSGTGEPRLDVAIVGDSFVEQSRDQFRAHAEADGMTVEVSAFGGTAACDHGDELAAYAERQPDTLIVSFAGNDITPCMERGPAPSPEQTAQEYEVDFDSLVGEFLAVSPATRVYVVPPPPIRDAQYEVNAVAMRAMYDRYAAEHPRTEVVDVTPVLAPDGAFHASLPCESWEAEACGPDGTVQLREEDGIHLTAAGGERYARALLAAIDGG